jgi:phosphatidate cytidylyltransferase
MEACLAFEPHAVPVARSELKTRIISSVVLIPVALAAAAVGGWPFVLVVTAVGAVSLWEWTAITGAFEPQWLRVAAVFCLVAGLLALAWTGADWSIVLIAVPALLGLVAGYLRPPFGWTGLGLVYVAVPCAALLVLREVEPLGWAAVFFIFFVVWATDVGAYFGGRSIGGPKLWPRVSPKKTWSGALAGILAGVVAGGLAAALMRAGDLVTALLLAAPLSAAAQAGDLFESAVKRRFGIKDSGALIPGHGGILDRVDGLFGAAALAWLIAGIGIGGDLLVLPDHIVAMTGDPS